MNIQDIAKTTGITALSLFFASAVTIFIFIIVTPALVTLFLPSFSPVYERLGMVFSIISFLFLLLAAILAPLAPLFMFINAMLPHKKKR